MNKDKAIQLLERLQDPEPYEPMLTKDAYDAIQMAIDALSADDDTISRKAAIEVIDSFNVFESRCDQIKLEQMIGELPPTNCSEFPNSSDTISRAKAIDEIKEIYEWHDNVTKERIIEHFKQLPPAQPAQHIPDQNGDIWITVPDIDEVTCIYVQESKSKFCRIFYEEQPERIKGRWVEIASSNHTYKCSECGRLLVNITDGKNNVAKNYPYCHCGAEMRGEQK